MTETQPPVTPYICTIETPTSYLRYRLSWVEGGSDGRPARILQQQWAIYDAAADLYHSEWRDVPIDKEA